MCLTISLFVCYHNEQTDQNKLSKDEILDSYTACVESKLSSLTLPDFSELVSNPSLIDTHLESIVRILLATAFDSIPIKKFLPHVKPGWTPEVNSAHGISKRAYTRPGLQLDALDAVIIL